MKSINKKQNSSRKKKMLAAAAALAIIAVLSGTFAWITAQDQRINRASSAAIEDDSVTITEVWEPKPLVAGTEAKKEVSVSNSGVANVFVRASYEEVLRHLSAKGEQKFDASTVAGAKYSYVANDTGLNHHMPINYNGAKKLDDGYEIVPTAQVTGLEADTKLLVKGGKVTEPVTGKVTISYDPIVVHEYYTHPDNVGKNPGDAGYDAEKNQYQMMKYNVDYIGTEESLTEHAKNWDFNLTTLTYGYYENGYMNTVSNWANSTLPDADDAYTGHALLGTAGTRHGVSYDYTLAGLDLPAIPTPAPAALADQIPTAATEIKGVQADTVGLGKSHIRIGYGASVVDMAGLAAASNNWVYNKDDGWFYYTQVLEASKSTATLLDKLIFESAMGVEYTNATYDLDVKIEAIQANEDALTDSAGWNLGNGAAPTGDTLAIVNKLTGK